MWLRDLSVIQVPMWLHKGLDLPSSTLISTSSSKLTKINCFRQHALDLAQMSEIDGDSKVMAPSIDVKSLSYSFPDGSSGLRKVILNLPPGSRTLLIGGNIFSISLVTIYSDTWPSQWRW